MTQHAKYIDGLADMMEHADPEGDYYMKDQSVQLEVGRLLREYANVIRAAAGLPELESG